jgi:putative RecB family exonuclease
MACHSYSALSAFEQCPKKYEHRYKLKTPVSAPTTVEAFLGSRVHEALERLYRDISMGREPTADDLVEWFRKAWRTHWSDDVKIVRDEYAAEDYRRSGELMLRGFHGRYAPFDDGVTVGLELRISADLDDEGCYGLVGYIDRLVRVGEGRYEIHDYKTGRTLPTQSGLDEDLQLALYELAVRRSYTDAQEVSLVWHYLALDTELRSKRSPEQLEAMRQDVIRRLRRVESADEFPTRTSDLCAWCEYRGLCPAWTHADALADGAAAGEALEGSALVDRLSEVERRVAEFEAEAASLRERLVAWADASGYERVEGTGCSAKIWRSRNSCSLPAWDDPARREIEGILHESGLWDEYSSVATVRLARALEAGDLPEGVGERIMQYVTVGPRTRVYLNRRR